MGRGSQKPDAPCAESCPSGTKKVSDALMLPTKTSTGVAAAGSSTGPCGPFTVTHLDDNESSLGPSSDRSSSPSDRSSSSSGDDLDPAPPLAVSGDTGGNAVVIQANDRKGLSDAFSVALVAGFLVPCFTVFAPLTVIGPLVIAAKYGLGRYMIESNASVVS